MIDKRLPLKKARINTRFISGTWFETIKWKGGSSWSTFYIHNGRRWHMEPRDIAGKWHYGWLMNMMAAARERFRRQQDRSEPRSPQSKVV